MTITKELFTFSTSCGVLALIAATCLVFTETTCTAQTLAQDDNTSSQNIEILKELQEMRARIQQLEAQLKTQSGGGAATPQSATLQSASLSVFSNSRTAAQEQPVQAEKKKPAQPFAFADFTWLNGTARTKTPAFDSAFFTPEIRADVDYIYSFSHPSDNTISGSSGLSRE